MEKSTEQGFSLIAESSGVKLEEAGTNLYLVRANGHGQIYYTWPEAEANFERRVQELASAPAPRG